MHLNFTWLFFHCHVSFRGSTFYDCHLSLFDEVHGLKVVTFLRSGNGGVGSGNSQVGQSSRVFKGYMPGREGFLALVRKMFDFIGFLLGCA